MVLVGSSSEDGADGIKKRASMRGDDRRASVMSDDGAGLDDTESSLVRRESVQRQPERRATLMEPPQDRRTTVFVDNRDGGDGGESETAVRHASVSRDGARRPSVGAGDRGRSGSVSAGRQRTISGGSSHDENKAVHPILDGSSDGGISPAADVSRAVHPMLDGASESDDEAPGCVHFTFNVLFPFL